MDAWLITNTGVTFIDNSLTPISYTGIGDEMNTIETTNAGSLKFSIEGKQTKSTDGGLGVILANTAGSKKFPEFALTVGTIVNGTNTGTNGELLIIKRTSSIAVMDIPVSVTNYLPTFRIIDLDATALAGTTTDYAGTQVTYDDVLQKLVVATGGTVGSKVNIKVLAENPKGVTGEQSFSIIL
jgi:hypothetical protein